VKCKCIETAILNSLECQEMTLDRLDGSWALDLDMLSKQRPRVRLQQNSGSLSCVKREWSVARTSAISAGTNSHSHGISSRSSHERKSTQSRSHSTTCVTSDGSVAVFSSIVSSSVHPQAIPEAKRIPALLICMRLSP
jgi:hypothetical protein